MLVPACSQARMRVSATRDRGSPMGWREQGIQSEPLQVGCIHECIHACTRISALPSPMKVAQALPGTGQRSGTQPGSRSATPTGGCSSRQTCRLAKGSLTALHRHLGLERMQQRLPSFYALPRRIC